jgi:hypothetical protein
MKLHFFNFLLLITSVLLLPFSNVFAANIFKISPPIIDLKLYQRDIASTTVNFENQGPTPIRLFVFIDDIGAVAGKKDNLSSLSSWIEMSPTVDVVAKGSASIPISIKPHPLATPGIYHASVSFVQAYTQYEAEDRKSMAKTVTINLEIAKDDVTRLSLVGFNSDRAVYFGGPVVFQYGLRNVGNQSVTPTVHVRIYDNKGREVAELSPQSTSTTVDIGAELKDSLIWQNSAFGRHKAYFVADYGSSQTASVQDTVYFWIIPWYIFVLFAVGLLTVLALTSLLYGFFSKKG